MQTNCGTERIPYETFFPSAIMIVCCSAYSNGFVSSNNRESESLNLNSQDYATASDGLCIQVAENNLMNKMMTILNGLDLRFLTSSA